MFENRKYIIIFVFSLVCFVFIARLFSIQVLDENYKLAAQNNAIHKVVDYPYRGVIYDRTGKLIVANDPVFDLMVVPKEVKEFDTLGFCDLLQIKREDFDKKILEARGYSYVKPSTFMKQLNLIDFARIQDKLINYRGFYVQARTLRSYPQPVMANALGYIAEISKSQLEKQTDGYYRQGDYIGKNGLEAYYEKELRGKRGSRFVMVNVRGIEKGSYKDGELDTMSIAGMDFTSTVDVDLQIYGEKLMRGKIGSVVAIEPSTGEILSIISAPTYDPSLLAGRQFSTYFDTLQKDTTKPLFNRPLMAMYPPGSIFKMVQALIGLQEGVISPSTSFPCLKKQPFNCHNHVSPLDLFGSIQHSCNPYYYQVFKRIMLQDESTSAYKDAELGLQKWRDYVLSFGLGQKLGVDLPNEKGGIVASKNLYDKVYGEGRWKFSTIYSLAIGQGEIGVVPLQMANLAAIIANKGYYYTPHLVKGIGETMYKPEEFMVKHYAKVDSQHYQVVIDAMQEVVDRGTGASARIKGIEVCGKTGTAQNPQGEDHSVFIAFAPKHNPKIAISVYVENAGWGGSWAAPIASLMIEKYLTDSISRPQLEKRMVDADVYK
ncbi:MAG TPA: penicillin-binding protein 2 [Cytophagales bacterium]|nr:penicillin-binding protein 2 [Cytophagales bacterium]